MKHKIIFHKILFLVIVCIAFFGTAMIYKATKDLATAYGWKGTIEKMIDANDEVNFLFEKSLLEADYDAVMHRARSRRCCAWRPPVLVVAAFINASKLFSCRLQLFPNV